MALNVETGSGSASADSYASLADATAWHAARGATAWAAIASDALREQALVRATQYMVQVYRQRWAGRRMTATQALDWPRYMVPVIDAPGGYGLYPAYYPQDTVPAEVRNACCELALSAAAGDLAPNIGRLKESVEIGPIKTTYSATAPAFTRYRAVDNMLQPFMAGGSGFSIALSRA